MAFGIAGKDKFNIGLDKDVQINNYIKEKKEKETKKISNILEIGDTVAEFTALLNKAKPRKIGMVAQFFGADGPEADIITGLHLTRFQNVFVKVSVWMLRDKNGAVLFDPEKKKPITEFIAKIERPKPSNEGQTAMFYGISPEDSDAINILNQSEYQDSLVYVSVQLAQEKMSADKIQTERPADISEKVHTMTPEEKIEFERKQKNYRDSTAILIKSGFFKSGRVIDALLTKDEILEYVKTKPCCCKELGEECQHKNESIIAYPYGKSYHNVIPLCETHARMVDNKEDLGVQGIRNDFISTADAYNTFLTTLKLKQELNLNDEEEIPPFLLKQWTMKHDLYNLLPNKYLQEAENRGNYR